MKSEFEMSLMGELTYFLGLGVRQTKERIFVYQAKYIKEMLKKFGMKNVKSNRHAYECIHKII